MQAPKLNFDDIYDVWLAPWWQRPEVLLLVFFAVILVFVVSYFLWYLLKKRTKELCPYEKLRRGLTQELEELRKNGRFLKREGAVQLGELLREFVTNAAKVDACSCTEAEFSCLVDQCALDGEIKRLIKKVSELLTQSKFSPVCEGDFSDYGTDFEQLIDRLSFLSAQMKQKK